MQDSWIDKVGSTRADIREVGLREGLQSHAMVLPTAVKLALFQQLADAGLREINAVAFVNPHKMPQMADAEDLLRSIGALGHQVEISGLVLNERGLDRALAMKGEGLLDRVLLVFSPASQFAKNGIRVGGGDLLDQIEQNALRAHQAGLAVTVFNSDTFGTTAEGWVEQDLVVRNVQRIAAMPGVSEINISDSTGQADPMQVSRLFAALAEVLPTDRRIGFHLHDTRGAALANILAALASPFTHFVIDCAFGGLGGDYPFIEDSFGNVATEDAAEMFYGMGLSHGVDPDRVITAARTYSHVSGRTLQSRLSGSTGSLKWKRDRRFAAAN